jgi:hypothetical protein
MTDGQQAFLIEVHVTASENRELALESRETNLSLSVGDVSRDGTTDLVVEQAFTQTCSDLAKLPTRIFPGSGERGLFVVDGISD